MKIKNEDLKGELLDLPQMKVLEQLNGRWKSRIGTSSHIIYNGWATHQYNNFYIRYNSGNYYLGSNLLSDISENSFVYHNNYISPTVYVKDE